MQASVGARRARLHEPDLGVWRWPPIQTKATGLATITPMNIFVNGKPQACPADSTVADLIEQLGLTGKRLAVERNQALIPRSQHASTRLQESDRLEIVVAVGGG